ncbi:MAG: M56 family metallopeptidase [Clostridia bacterium]|nr:M56 family metallopeptidase [Clostridia bacterium]
MSKLFLHLLNISITAGWIVLIVVLLRFVLKKAPKWTRVVLWGLVALRLILPVSIESVTSLVPSAETVKIESVTAPVLTSVNEYNGVSFFYENVQGEQIVLQSGFPTLNSAVNPTPEEAAEHFDTVAVLKTVAGWVWLGGAAAMLLYALISYLRLKHRVRASVLLEKGVYVCDEISDPFILGLIVPKIYLPSGMDEQTRAYVLAHERAHLKRFDHIWKPLGFLLLAVYWFNPLLWLAYILLCRDIELACDEKVVKELDDTGKAAYSEALVTASVSRRSIAACPLAFGETGVKSRVKSVLNYKKPAFWIILVALLAGIATAVCFLTVPKKDKPEAEPDTTPVPGATGKVLEWLNYRDAFYELPWDGDKEMTIDVFPNVTFRWTSGSVEAKKDGKTRTLFTGMPIFDVFFTDVTGDGKPELCASVMFGSGMIDMHIIVYDYANKQSYTLWDRGKYDYQLLTTPDGILYVEKRRYGDDKPKGDGTLTLQDGLLCCRWSDGSFTPLNRELHESELYGEWIVEAEMDNDGNVLYAFDVGSTWKEYNFREDGTVTYNETVPVSSDSELAFGHPVDYRYAVYDNYVHIEDGRSCTGYYDAQTQKLKLNYQPSPGQYVYATLRRMGEDAPVADKTYVGEWELVKIVDGRQEYDLAFLTAASGLENNRVVFRADGTGNYLLEVTGSESEDIGLTYTEADDENTVTVRFAEEMAYGYTMIAKYDPDSDTLSMYYPDDPTMYSVYCRAGSIQDDPAAELTIEMLVGKWVTEGNIMYDPPFLPGTLTFLEDGSASLWLDGYLRSGEALDFQTALTGNMVYFSGYLSGNTFASYDAKTDTLRLRLPLASAGTLVFTRDRSADASQTLEEILLGTYVCTGAKQNELNIPVPAEYVGMMIDLGDTSGAESYRHVASVTVGGTKKEGYDWKVDENDILIVWNPETGDNLQFEWFPKQTACTTLKLTIGQENPITLFFTFDD